jgi:hypothetical protein
MSALTRTISNPRHACQSETPVIWKYVKISFKCEHREFSPWGRNSESVWSSGQSFSEARVRFLALPEKKYWVWNGVHSASWVQLRSYLIEKLYIVYTSLNSVKHIYCKYLMKIMTHYRLIWQKTAKRQTWPLVRWLRWRGPAVAVNYWPVLSSERALQHNKQ